MTNVDNDSQLRQTRPISTKLLFLSRKIDSCLSYRDEQIVFVDCRPFFLPAFNSIQLSTNGYCIAISIGNPCTVWQFDTIRFVSIRFVSPSYYYIVLTITLSALFPFLPFLHSIVIGVLKRIDCTYMCFGYTPLGIDRTKQLRLIYYCRMFTSGHSNRIQMDNCVSVYTLKERGRAVGRQMLSLVLLVM